MIEPKKTDNPWVSLLFRAQFFLFRVLTMIVNRLSSGASVRLAEGIGSLLFLRKRRRDFSVQNLHRAFPEKSEKDIQTIGRHSMQSMVKVIFEFIRLPLISKKPQDYIEIQGEQHVWEALKQGKGVLLVVSHFGNWELAGIAAAAKGMPIYAVGKPNKNPLVDRYIKKTRGLTGLQTIDQKGAVQSCIRLLKQNKIIAMLIDEHAKKGGVWVNFFKHKASTSAMPATLALKYGAPVIPVIFYREKNKKSVLVFDKPFTLKQTDDSHADILANTQQYMNYLQKEVMKRPDDWTLWMHNRWRGVDSQEAA